MKNKIDDYFRFTIIKKSFNNKFLIFLYFNVKNKLFKNNEDIYRNRHKYFKEFKQIIDNNNLFKRK